MLQKCIEIRMLIFGVFLILSASAEIPVLSINHKPMTEIMKTGGNSWFHNLLFSF